MEALDLLEKETKGISPTKRAADYQVKVESGPNEDPKSLQKDQRDKRLMLPILAKNPLNKGEEPNKGCRSYRPYSKCAELTLQAKPKSMQIFLDEDLKPDTDHKSEI